MARKMRMKMVNLSEIKKDHTLFRNDFFKADPFLGVKLKGFYVTNAIIDLITNRDV